jgi:excisionase family DNA binding protein
MPNAGDEVALAAMQAFVPVLGVGGDGGVAGALHAKGWPPPGRPLARRAASNARVTWLTWRNARDGVRRNRALVMAERPRGTRVARSEIRRELLVADRVDGRRVTASTAPRTDRRSEIRAIASVSIRERSGIRQNCPRIRNVRGRAGAGDDIEGIQADSRCNPTRQSRGALCNAREHLRENAIMPNPTILPTGSTLQARRAAGISSADFEILPAVLTSREAANVLRVGVREVRALVDSGQLAGRRLGPRRVIRISRAAVLALLGVQSPR